tara:strand:+ start:78 stop:800 length:723 start_codon:yes stop_codon:yes gene_type:complete
MSHLTQNHIKHASFELQNISGWQYGQKFMTIGRNALQFYVTPFRVHDQRIHIKGSDDIDACSKEVIHNELNEKQHVFCTYRTQKDFDADKCSKTWLNEFEGNPEKYDFKHSANRTETNPDQISDVIMKKTGERGFKYTVNFDGNGNWNCNCGHHKHNSTTCCKHINACIDYHCHEVAMIPREESGKSNPKWAPYTTTVLLSGCLVNREPIKMTFPGFTDIVWDLTEVLEVEPDTKRRRLL